MAHLTKKQNTENQERAERAQAALMFYAKSVNEEDEPFQCLLTDLLTDLRHLAASTDGNPLAEPMDYERASESSLGHYEAERDGEV